MPWKEICVMDERMRFIARLLDGESMSRLCEEFGISRKTGYKIWNRYQTPALTPWWIGAASLIASETNCPNSWNGPLSRLSERSRIGELPRSGSS